MQRLMLFIVIILGLYGCGDSLHDVVIRGDQRDTDKLLQEGVDVNKTDGDGNTALMYALSLEKNTITDELLKKGSDTTVRNDIGNSLLHAAVIYNKMDKVKLFVERDKNQLDDGNEKGQTPLHYAAYLGHLTIMKYLLEQGAQMGKADKGGYTAVHYAAQNGKVDVLKFLLEQKANFNVQTAQGFSPLHLAVIYGKSKVAEFLVKDAGVDPELKTVLKGRTALHGAAITNGWDEALILLENKANVNAQDKDGLAPLHFAAYRDNLRLVQLLLEKGADVTLKDNDGHSAYWYADDKNNLKIKDFLKSKGLTQ